MKLSFRSKLIARTTPGFRVRSDRPMAESASALIIPPWTKPEWFAMSSVVFISTVAEPSPVSTVSRPSQLHALEGVFSSLTTLALRDGQACRRGARHEPALLVQDVSLAEHQGLLDLDNPSDGANSPRDDGPDEIDLELDRRVPHPVFLERGQRHPHRRIRDLGDHSSLHHAAAVAVLRSGLELQHDAARLSLGDASAKRLHPPVRLRGKEPFGALDVLHRPRRPGR